MERKQKKIEELQQKQLKEEQLLVKQQTPLEVDNDEFYKRNLEFLKKKEETIQKKKQEQELKRKEQDDQCEFKPVINETGVKRTFDDLVNWHKSKNQKIHQEQIKEIAEAKNMSNTYKAKKIPINEKFRDVIQKHLENKFLEQEDFGERLYSYNDYYTQRKKELENKIYSQNHVPLINKEYPVESTIRKALANSLEKAKKQKEKDFLTLNSSYQTGYLQQNT